VETLAKTLTVLSEQPELREAMGVAAREYIREEHDLERSADLYVAALEETAGGSAVEEAVLGEVARAAHDVGLDPYGPELGEVGRSIREVGLGR
jgi:hypothetical protein